MAPLQSFSDYVYRNAYAKVFPWINKYFIPYLSLEGNGEIRNSRKKEILSENNKTTNAIPQILTGSVDETRKLCQFIEQAGYKELSINLGCPHTMVTKKNKGAGLLAFPDKIKDILYCINDEFDLKISIKSRTGASNHNEFEKVLDVLNTFNINEIILHPRTGNQMYRGESDTSQFLRYSKMTNIPIIYNGDISSYNFIEIIDRLNKPNSIMIGRGILSNVFLPAEINKLDFTFEKWRDFHNHILDGYLADQDNEGNALNKLKKFWTYFGEMFPNNKKEKKLIKKSRNLLEYKEIVCRF